MTRTSTSSRARSGFWVDSRGSVTVEYAVLLATVALGCALAIASLGVPLFKMYMAHRAWLLLPMP